MSRTCQPRSSPRAPTWWRAGHSDRAFLEMFHAVKPPDLLNCVSDFNPDYRSPRPYVDGQLKLGKPQFHTADEVTEDMSKELIVGKKAEDELTQLLDTFCGGGLCVGHVDVALKREYPALNQTPAPTELPTQAPSEAPTAVTTDVPTALPTSLPTVSALACPSRSPRTRPRRSQRAFRCTCRRARCH